MGKTKTARRVSEGRRKTRRARDRDDVSILKRNSLDASHDSGARGEHRYPDAHQTDAEQTARRDRDALKRRLADVPNPSQAATRRKKR
jgi:hypothetical protein